MERKYPTMIAKHWPQMTRAEQQRLIELDTEQTRLMGAEASMERNDALAELGEVLVEVARADARGDGPDAERAREALRAAGETW